MVRARVVLLVIVCAGVGTSASAQISPEGSIRGYVKDEQNAVLPGVVLMATSPTVAGAFSTTSDDEGHYRLLNLPPGEYTLQAELSGFARYSREGILVRAALNLSIDITMQVGNVMETVEVKQETPLLETSKPIHAVNISGAAQRSLPLSSRRDWAQFLEIVPGIVGPQNSRQPSYYFHGSSGSSHSFTLDGADITSAQAGSNLWIGLSSEAIEDVQVTTSGPDLAATLGLGAVANVALPTGTDRYRFTGSLQYQPLQWNSANAPVSVSTSATIGLVQSDVSFSGPFRRGSLWFFGTHRWSRTEAGLYRDATQLAVLKALKPDFVPFNNVDVAQQYLVKITGRASKHLFSGFFEHDRAPTSSNLATYSAPFVTTRLGGPAISGRVQSVWSSSLLTTVIAAYNRKGQWNELSTLETPSKPVYTSVSASGGRLVGSETLAHLDVAGTAFDSPYEKASLAFSLTYLFPHGPGTHDLQGGAHVVPYLVERAEIVYPRDGFQTEDHVLRDRLNPGAGTVAFHRLYIDAPRVTTTDGRATDVAIYLSDSWRLKRMTLAAGVRVDRIRRTDELFDSVIQRSTEIAPRAGVNIALDRRATSVLFFNAGRAHDSLSLTRIGAGVNTALRRDVYDLDLNGSFETSFLTPGSTARLSERQFDESFHQGLADQVDVGASRQWPGLLQTTFMVTRRVFKDLPVQLETNGLYRDGVFVGYRDEGLNDIGLVTNNDWNRPVYTALTTHVTRDAGRLRLIASHVRQWRRLDGTWQPNDPAGVIQPGAFPDSRGIPDTRGNPFSVANGYAEIPGVQWFDHAVRVAGIVQLPWTVNVAANYVFQSGRWSGPILTRLSAPDPAFGPPRLTLSNGRLVSNPLGTTTRFAYATRGEGQIRTDAFHAINLRVGKTLRIGTGGVVDLGVDVFNLANGDSDQSFASRDLTSPLFGAGRARQAPRAAQLYCRVAF